MIYSVSGKLVITEPSFVVIDNNGIGYGIKTSMNTVSRLPKTGDNAMLFTYLHVKEDLLDLYGFFSKEELISFKQLISISGVGPKAAISILSELTPERFALCIATNDAKALTKAQGIGSKTAQRIVLELKDKVSKELISEGITSGDSVISGNSNTSEAISALVVLGYSQAEVTQVVTRMEQTLSVEDMIKAGLKALAMRFE